jgi:hypothetical protein
MNGDPISRTGKWVTPDGRVVENEPVEGRQLVAPGTPVTPDIRQAIEQAEAAAPAPAPADEPDDGDTLDSDSNGDSKAEPVKAEPESAAPRKRPAGK